MAPFENVFASSADLRSQLSSLITPTDLAALCKVSRCCRGVFSLIRNWESSLQATFPTAAWLLARMAGQMDTGHCHRIALAIFETRFQADHPRDVLLRSVPMSPFFASVEAGVDRERYLEQFAQGWLAASDQQRDRLFALSGGRFLIALCQTISHGGASPYGFLQRCLYVMLERGYPIPHEVDAAALNAVILEFALRSDSGDFMKFAEPVSDPVLFLQKLRKRWHSPAHSIMRCREWITELPSDLFEHTWSISDLVFFAQHRPERARELSQPLTLFERAVAVSNGTFSLHDAMLLLTDVDQTVEARFLRLLPVELVLCPGESLPDIGHLLDLWRGRSLNALAFHLYSCNSSWMARLVIRFCVAEGCSLSEVDDEGYTLAQQLVLRRHGAIIVDLLEELEALGVNLRQTTQNGLNLADLSLIHGGDWQSVVPRWLADQGIHSFWNRQGLYEEIGGLEPEGREFVVGLRKRTRTSVSIVQSSHLAVLAAAQQGRLAVLKRARLDELEYGVQDRYPLIEALTWGTAEAVSLILSRLSRFSALAGAFRTEYVSRVLMQDDPKERVAVAMIVGELIDRAHRTKQLPQRTIARVYGILYDLLFESYFCGRLSVQDLRDVLIRRMPADLAVLTSCRVDPRKITEMLDHFPAALFFGRTYMSCTLVEEALLEEGGVELLSPHVPRILAEAERLGPRGPWLKIWNHLIDDRDVSIERIIFWIRPVLRRGDKEQLHRWTEEVVRSQFNSLRSPGVEDFSFVHELLERLPEDMLDPLHGEVSLLAVLAECGSSQRVSVTDEAVAAYGRLLEFAASRSKAPLESCRDPAGRTPLHLACVIEAGATAQLSGRAVRTFLALGHPIDVVDGYGLTPKQVAKSLGNAVACFHLERAERDL